MLPKTGDEFYDRGYEEGWRKALEEVVREIEGCLYPKAASKIDLDYNFHINYVLNTVKKLENE